MSVFTLCEQAIGLVRGKRLILSDSEKALLEALNYEGLTAAHAQDEAVVCALHFARVRDRLLELHAWKFARKVTALGAGAALPSDCVTVLCVCVGGKPVDYVQTDNTLNVGTVSEVYYTAKITDVTKWSGLFSDVFCYSLAEEICAAVTGEAQYTQILEAKIQELLRRAYQTGAIQPETRLTETQELYHRAIVLSRGTRSISGSGNTASEQGVDVLGSLNWRTQAEMNACEASAPVVRDRLLEGYSWRFARKNAVLSRIGTTITGWSYGYSLPSDCVKVLSLFSGTDSVNFEQVGDKVYTNASTASARYTAKIEDAASWSGAFKDIFTYQLAADIIYATTGNSEIIKLLDSKIEQLINEAVSTGEIQEDTELSLSDDMYSRSVMLAHGSSNDIDTEQRARELEVCRNSADYIRNRLFGEYPWKFARKYKQVTGTGSGLTDWAYMADVPSDCAKVLTVLAGSEPIDFEDNGSKVYSNSTSMTVIYTATITDATQWPGIFADVFCYELAQEIIIATNNRFDALQALAAKSAGIIREAERQGAIQAETHISISQELYQRAINLLYGQRILKGTSERALSEGTDDSGYTNTRDTAALKACRLAAPNVRDRLLQLYPWVFARKSVTLTQGASVQGWSYGYVIPADCLKVLTVLSGGEAVDWEEANSYIYTNGSGAVVRYTVKIEDMQKWPGAFRDAFTYELAVEVGMATSGASEAIALLEQKLTAIIQDAYRMGAIKTETRIPVKQELYNRAIGLVKGLKTGSKTEIDTRYEDEISACKASFITLRDKLLQLHAWVFARKTDTPAQLTESVPGWKYTYTLPSDCLKVVAVIAKDDCSCLGNIELLDYEVSGSELYTNSDVVYVRYTAKLEDTTKWAAAFTEVLVAMLAIEVALNVIGDADIVTVLERRIKKVIDEAKANGIIREESGLPVKRDKYRPKIRTTPYLDYSGIPTFAPRGGYCEDGRTGELCLW